MKIKLLLLILVLLLLASALSGCSGSLYASTSWPGLTVSQGIAYLADNQYVYAINLETGTEIKRFPEKADKNKSFFAVPVLTPNGHLIAGGYDHVLYSLDPATLQELGSFKDAKDRYIASPLVTEQGIFAPNADGYLYALDFDLKPVWPKPFETGEALWAQPATDGQCQCLYLTSMDHNLYAINAGTGEQLWKLELGAASVGTPAVSDEGVLYVGTFGNEILAINAHTEAISQRYATSGWVWSGPALAHGRLYFGDIKGIFYILNASDLSEVTTIAADGPIVSTPLIISDTVYFTTEAGTLYTYDKDGNELRSPQTFDETGTVKLYAPVIAFGDLILLTPTGAKALLYAQDVNGAQKWPPFTPEK